MPDAADPGLRHRENETPVSKEMLMQTVTDHRLADLGKTLDTAVSFLQTVGETNWAVRLEDIRARMGIDPDAAIRMLAGAFEGDDGFNRLYLSGPRNGHSLSERQEIEAIAKLHVLRGHLHALAEDLRRSGA
jgi:hypothetical protein